VQGVDVGLALAAAGDAEEAVYLERFEALATGRRSSG
jgi:hypothetical protein